MRLRRINKIPTASPQRDPRELPTCRCIDLIAILPIFFSPKPIEFLRQDNRINKIIFFACLDIEQKSSFLDGHYLIVYKN
jgi:hypothetical protein